MHAKAGTILRMFRTEAGHVSGQHLSRELGVSRTAIWKHISSLRNNGYLIEAVPSRGYRLVSSPDIIDPGELRAQLVGTRVGRRLEFLKTTASTNADAFRLAENGAVIFEVGAGQAGDVAAMMRDSGLPFTAIRRDLGGHERVVAGAASAQALGDIANFPVGRGPETD